MTKVSALLILSLVLLLVVSAVQTGATGAGFSDTETSIGNTFMTADNWGDIEACINIYPGLCLIKCLCPPIIVTVTLPYDSGHSAAEIDMDSIKLSLGDKSVAAKSGRVHHYIGDLCDDCCPLLACCTQLVLAFDRDSVDEMLHGNCGEHVVLSLNGYLSSGEFFSGTDTVWVKHCSIIDYGITEAEIHFIPGTINLSESGPISCIIQFSDKTDISSAMNSSFILANDNFISTQPESVEIGDHDGDGISDILCTLNRSDIENFLAGKTGDVALQLSGTLVDGNTFSCTTVISVSAGADYEVTPTPEATLAPEPTPTPKAKPEATPTPEPTPKPEATPEPTS
jgi:hypothetical protein